MIETFGIDEVIDTLSTFRSVRDSATESFLKEKAIDMEIRDVSRTYLAVSDEEMNILGYITISIKCLMVPNKNELTGKMRKSMNIDTKKNIVQSYLIGQLSRSADSPKGLGKDLLDMAFDILSQAKDLVGCRMVRLDCHDEMVGYYSDYGFRLITRNENRTINQMMAFILSKPVDNETKVAET